MIKFVYFDVGGVVIKDFSGTDKWEQVIKEWGIPKNKFQEFEKYFDEQEIKVSKGFGFEKLIPDMEEKFGIHFGKGYSLLDSFVDRFEKNETIFPVLQLAKQNHKIGLLTNMYPGMLQTIKDKNLLPDISWDIIIDSSIEGYAKPEGAIFQIARERSGTLKEEILFVENSLRNVEAAKEFGLQVFWYDSKDYPNSSRKLYNFLKNEI